MGEETEVTDAHEARGKHVEQKASQELVHGQGHEARLVAVGGVSPTEGDLVARQGNEAMVGDSHPERARTHLTPEEAVTIEEKLTDPRHRMAWKLFLWAGSRCGEIRGLRWRSVVWEHSTIVVTESVWEGNSTPPKTKKG
jgi:integrase